MRWLAFNAFGAVSWVIGLMVAKTASLSAPNPFDLGNSQFDAGLTVGLMGLAVLLWANLAPRGVD